MLLLFLQIQVEGSSDNNVSPPTSVIQGESEKTNGNGGSHTYEWIKSGSTGHKWSVSKEFLSHHEELNSDKFSPKYSSNSNAKNSSSGGQVGPANGFHSLEEEVCIFGLVDVSALDVYSLKYLTCSHHHEQPNIIKTRFINRILGDVPALTPHGRRRNEFWGGQQQTERLHV